jgi:hypothetical protein
MELYSSSDSSRSNTKMDGRLFRVLTAVECTSLHCPNVRTISKNSLSVCPPGTPKQVASDINELSTVGSSAEMTTACTDESVGLHCSENKAHEIPSRFDHDPAPGEELAIQIGEVCVLPSLHTPWWIRDDQIERRRLELPREPNLSTQPRNGERINREKGQGGQWIRADAPRRFDGIHNPTRV